MNSGNNKQKSWKTSDGSPWWLRSTRYNEPNGDYSANCFLNLWHNPKNENSVIPEWAPGVSNSNYVRMFLWGISDAVCGGSSIMSFRLDIVFSFNFARLEKSTKLAPEGSICFPEVDNDFQEARF